MAFFRFLFNLLWFVLGGIFMGLAWWLAGLLCFISLVGIPWGAPASSLAPSPSSLSASRRSVARR